MRSSSRRTVSEVEVDIIIVIIVLFVIHVRVFSPMILIWSTIIHYVLLGIGDVLHSRLLFRSSRGCCLLAGLVVIVTASCQKTLEKSLGWRGIQIGKELVVKVLRLRHFGRFTLRKPRLAVASPRS